MTEFLIAVASAFWLGILTSISPCSMATNIAAISFVGRRVDSPFKVFLAGLLYTTGRTITYLVLGILLVSSLLSAPHVSHILQKYMNKLLGPILILVGMLLLELISTMQCAKNLTFLMVIKIGIIQESLVSQCTFQYSTAEQNFLKYNNQG